MRHSAWDARGGERELLVVADPWVGPDAELRVELRARVDCSVEPARLLAARVALFRGYPGVEPKLQLVEPSWVKGPSVSCGTEDVQLGGTVRLANDALARELGGGNATEIRLEPLTSRRGTIALTYFPAGFVPPGYPESLFR